MLNWNEIADRFFSLYPERQQSEIAKQFQVKQVSVSRWKNHIEKVPMRVLEQVIDSEGVTWDWLFEGVEPKYRRNLREDI